MVRAWVPLRLAMVISPAMAQVPAPLATRANDLVTFLNGGMAPESLFAPSFLAKIPPDKIRALTGQLTSALGAATSVTVVSVSDATSAKLRLGFAHGSAEGSLTIDPAAPNRVTGLYLANLQPQGQSPAQVVEALSALPGRTNFLFARIGDGPLRPIAARNPDQAFAIGSAFKLVILAELVRETAAGEREWDDMITLDGRALPGGAYTRMPAGTKVSLLELAQKMISISDNSATDILLATLGRAKVEAMMPVVGWHDAARSRPFLSTLEMFKIKGITRFRERWPTLDELGRRALLAEIDAAPISEFDATLFGKDSKPALIDQAEWFASPADLARTMDWLRTHTESGPAAPARAILSINPAVQRGPDTAQWTYVGYKGGSEPGVITMTWLLQGKDGWYVMSGGWNNPDAPIDDTRFIAMMTSAVAGAGK